MMIRVFTLAVTLIALCTAPLSAAVTGVSASPNPITVNDQGSALANVRWTVEVTTSTPTTLVSTVGTVTGGPSAETPGRQLQKRITTLGVTTHRFRERIRISRASLQALRSGATVTYSRAWSDGGAPATLVLALQLTSGGELSIRSSDLKFGNDSSTITVARGEALTAYARITSAGRGRFNGVWQVSGPNGGSTASFVPVGRVRQMLAGPRSTVFESPELPTDRPGSYLVRLLPDPGASDVTAGVFPTIRYRVLPSDGADAITLNTPSAGASITPATRFAWISAAGAQVYRLEFLAEGSVGTRNRVAAVDVAAPATTTSIRSFTAARLARNGAKFWRVLAYSSDGNLIAASAPRRIGGTD